MVARGGAERTRPRRRRRRAAGPRRPRACGCGRGPSAPRPALPRAPRTGSPRAAATRRPSPPAAGVLRTTVLWSSVGSLRWTRPQWSSARIRLDRRSPSAPRRAGPASAGCCSPARAGRGDGAVAAVRSPPQWRSSWPTPATMLGEIGRLASHTRDPTCSDAGSDAASGILGVRRRTPRRSRHGRGAAARRERGGGVDGGPLRPDGRTRRVSTGRASRGDGASSTSRAARFSSRSAEDACASSSVYPAGGNILRPARGARSLRRGVTRAPARTPPAARGGFRSRDRGQLGRERLARRPSATRASSSRAVRNRFSMAREQRARSRSPTVRARRRLPPRWPAIAGADGAEEWRPASRRPSRGAAVGTDSPLRPGRCETAAERGRARPSPADRHLRATGAANSDLGGPCLRARCVDRPDLGRGA